MRGFMVANANLGQVAIIKTNYRKGATHASPLRRLQPAATFLLPVDCDSVLDIIKISIPVARASSPCGPGKMPGLL